MQEALQKIFSNRITSTLFLLSVAAGAVVSIAGGFYATFQLVTMLGNG